MHKSVHNFITDGGNVFKKVLMQYERKSKRIKWKIRKTQAVKIPAFLL